MSRRLEEVPEPPNPIAVRHRPSTGEWFVWSSFLEKPISKMFSAKESAENALAGLMLRRR